MDFLRKNFEVAQKQAAEAAAKAKVLAQQVSDKTQVLAQQAGDNAAVFAQQVSDKTKEYAVHAKATAQNFTKEDAREALQKLGFGKGAALHSSDPEPTKEELECFGLTEDFLIFLRGLTYSTFRDYTDVALDDVGFVNSEKGVQRLNPWQERHAKLVLKTVKELQDLRYVLCPRRMEEERFWKIYFALAHKHLPEGCTTGALPTLSDLAPKAPPLTGHYTFVKASDVSQEESESSEKIVKVTENDPLTKEEELDAYLENVLNEGAEGGEVGGVSGIEEEDFDDLEEYMDQLNAEMGSTDDPVEISSGDLEGASGSKDDGKKPSQEEKVEA